MNDWRDWLVIVFVIVYPIIGLIFWIKNKSGGE